MGSQNTIFGYTKNEPQKIGSSFFSPIFFPYLMIFQSSAAANSLHFIWTQNSVTKIRGKMKKSQTHFSMAPKALPETRILEYTFHHYYLPQAERNFSEA